MQFCALTGQEPDPEVARQWDVQVNVLKNRNGQYEGRIGFDFHDETCQYLDSRGARPRKYIQWSKGA